VHDIAGPHLRGLGIGIYFSTVNICAHGIGSPLIGKLSDKLGVAVSPEVMRYSLLVCPVACALSALLLWRSSRALQLQRKAEQSALCRFAPALADVTLTNVALSSCTSASLILDGF
jgi:hypothetical protein